MTISDDELLAIGWYLDVVYLHAITETKMIKSKPRLSGSARRRAKPVAAIPVPWEPEHHALAPDQVSDVRRWDVAAAFGEVATPLTDAQEALLVSGPAKGRPPRPAADIAVETALRAFTALTGQRAEDNKPAAAKFLKSLDRFYGLKLYDTARMAKAIAVNADVDRCKK